MFILVFVFQSSQVSDSSGGKSEEKVGDGRYSSHSLDEVAGMMRGTISLYEVKVNMHCLELFNVLLGLLYSWCGFCILKTKSNLRMKFMML